METSPTKTAGSETWGDQIAASLHAQRDRVREFLAKHQSRLERAEAAIAEELERLETAAAGTSDHAGDDFHRRYQMALDDLRELKTKNAELQQQLNQARMATTQADKGHAAGRALSWEAEKIRILAMLESELDANDPQQRAERLRIEDVLQSTEKALAEKDRQIQELQRQGTGPIRITDENTDKTVIAAQLLDGDNVVREERERLRLLQDEWREKLRQAEIDLSMERAKLARQRAEWEEKFHQAKSDSAKEGETDAASDRTESSTRGRWLARLGLTEGDRERGRRR